MSNVKLLATVDHHHNNPLPTWKVFVASITEALIVAVQEEWSETITQKDGKALIARLTARLKTEANPFEVLNFDEDGQLVVRMDKLGALTIGQQLLDTNGQIDKWDACWVKVEQWQPKAEDRLKLAKMDKDELIDMLLELEATK